MNAEQLPAKKMWKRVGGVLACLFLAWLMFGLPDALRAHNNWSQWVAATKALQSLPVDLKESIEEYRSAKVADGKSLALAAEVPIQELVSAGNLKPADIAGLAGHRTFVLLQADATSPNSVVVRVEMPNGRWVVLNADGSVIMLPPK